MNQAVIKRVTLWCFFKSIALFIVTLSHPRSEDVIAVALKSGFTSWLLHHSYVVEQGAGALSGHSASTEGYLCLSHLLFYSQQRKLSHYRILISWVANWSVLVESCNISQVCCLGWDVLQPSSSSVHAHSDASICICTASPAPPVPQPSDGPGGCHLIFLTEETFGCLLVKKWTQDTRISWQHTAVLVYQ